MADFQGIADSVIKGDAPTVSRLTQAALDEGVAPQEVLNQGLVAGMNVIGKRFKANEIYIPEVLISAMAMKAGMQILKPKLVECGAQPVGKVVLGTVAGDQHDIGKNLVGMMLQGAGFDVVDIGVDQQPNAFIQAVKDSQAPLVGLSALLTTTMPAMKEAVAALRQEGVAVKIAVGGAPITQAFADEIGADGFAADAGSAVDMFKGLAQAG